MMLEKEPEFEDSLLEQEGEAELEVEAEVEVESDLEEELEPDGEMVVESEVVTEMEPELRRDIEKRVSATKAVIDAVASRVRLRERSDPKLDGGKAASISDGAPVKMIDGVGEVKAEALQSAGFETVGDIRQATLSELEEVIGIGHAGAARIKAFVEVHG